MGIGVVVLSFADTIKHKIIESEHFASVRGNVRLQWMLVAILVLLCVYIGKISVDGLQEDQQALSQQAQLYARLLATFEADINEEELQRWQDVYNTTLSAIPVATSASIAEASALAQLENTLSPLLNRARLNLLGAEESVVAGKTFYKVRVELSGQLNTDRLTELLQSFANNRNHFFLQTMNYSPRASNTVSFVIDVLFVNKQSSNDKITGLPSSASGICSDNKACEVAVI
jgi:preprotein translocase subunit SecD